MPCKAHSGCSSSPPPTHTHLLLLRTCRKMLWTLDKASRLLFWCGPSFLLAGILKVAIHLSFGMTFASSFLVLGGLYLLVASFEIKAKGKAVLVTGCDSGFGHALAQRLDSLGFRVFAGCLRAHEEGAQRLQFSASSRLHVLQLDITKEEQVNKALQEVKVLLSPRELWGVVNNAGISTFGAVEWTPLQTFQDVASVNIFGHIRVIKAFLPLIRNSKGRVVTVTSAEGLFTSPFVAAYDLTKHAMEGFADCLRHEMQRFGVHVCIVEPGNYTAGTKLNTSERAKKLGQSLWSDMTEEVRHAYGRETFARVVSSMENVTNTGLVDLTTAVNAMVEALTQRFPQARYTCMDLKLYIRGLVAQHMPEWIYDFFYINEVRNTWYS
ncbi:D-beta-hydroxybutyrate dehydrogenase, mitochondrial-like isoform X2 [Penaeus japonicus]|uniref:D-beta-hydroxybutyrate dehydrogenase, mitochondrial-like isoform X2 n=1 Tax=Penaeus japonicus TaxID=27405 RepID=UPI001C711C99|nr:D-beta-hydroxybutyrate dehydrogenase, mitochondrial-like isoform X2 [Penaeus japonicus]